MISKSNNEEDCFFSEIDDEYIHTLYRREKHLPSLSSMEEWSQCARLESIAWILRRRATLGFRYQTAYLAVIYFDQFLARRSINRENGWVIRLLSVACLCVAAKMEECTVPLLSDFFGAENCDLYKFESNVVQRMELLLLNTLEWNMILVMPFAYINCFVVKCCGDDPSMRRSINSRFMQIIMASMNDVNLMSHRPSVIALAATLVALDSKLTVPELELKITANSPFSSGFLKMADIVSCYNRMKELTNIEFLTPSECMVPQNSSHLGCGEKKFVESHVISGLGNTRKRLVYEDSDKKYGKPDEKRLR